MTRPVFEPSEPRDIANHEWRTRQLERRAGGEWIYVGTFIGPGNPGNDPNTTADSPPFQNSWANKGGSWQELRFRWLMDGGVEIEGVVTGGTAATVVFTLPDGIWRRDKDLPVAGIDPDTGLHVGWLVEANGDVTFLG